MSSTAFRRFLSWYAGVGLEKQQNLYDQVGDPDWEADLEAGVLTLGNRSFGVQLLGTESAVTGTWLWAWANTSVTSQAVVTQAQQLRLTGETSAIEEYTAGQFSLEVADGFQLAIAASGHLGLSGAVYRGPYDDGAALFYVPQGLVLQAPTAERTINTILQSIQTWELDHELVVEGYAASRSLTLEKPGNWILHLPVSNETVRISFDGENRIRQLKARHA